MNSGSHNNILAFLFEVVAMWTWHTLHGAVHSVDTDGDFQSARGLDSSSNNRPTIHV